MKAEPNAADRVTRYFFLFPAPVALGALLSQTPAAIAVPFVQALSFWALVLWLDGGPRALSRPLVDWCAAASLGFLSLCATFALLAASALVRGLPDGALLLLAPGWLDRSAALSALALFAEGTALLWTALSCSALARGAEAPHRAALAGLRALMRRPLAWLGGVGVVHACLLGPAALAFILSGNLAGGFLCVVFPLALLCAHQARKPLPGSAR